MIISEEYGNNLIRHYSDSGYYILQVGTNKKFIEAVDVFPSQYTYLETSELIQGLSEDVFLHRFANENISKNVFFNFNNKIYKSTLAIEKGAQIKPGYNCYEVDIAEILNKQQEKE